MALRGPLCVSLGIANSYVLPTDSGYILIDAGSRGTEDRLWRALAYHAIDPHEIRLIILTHTHFDHVGGLQAIQERCSAPMLVHHREAAWITEGRVVIPAGIYPHTRVFGAVARRMTWAFQFAPCTPDYIIGDEHSLTGFGLDARIVHTPGHSQGSISVLLSSGAAYIGDLCYNAFPCGLGPIVPVYADDVPSLYHSWQRLLDLGAQRFYPAHGRPFDARRLRSVLHARLGHTMRT